VVERINDRNGDFVGPGGVSTDANPREMFLGKSIAPKLSKGAVASGRRENGKVNVAR